MRDGWLFGYGSLIWNPGFAYSDRRLARLDGFERRFWQGSHDHRGWPESPGRVVTLVPGSHCWGVAYQPADNVAEDLFRSLDNREKNGYQRRNVSLHLDNEEEIVATVYFADAGNFAFSGPAPDTEIAAIIAASEGPSGTNREYLYELAAALRQLDVDDPHVFELERLVRAIDAN